MNQSISASTFAALMPAPPPVSAAWRPFFLQVIDRETPLHLTAAAFADHVLTTQISGTPRLRQEVCGRAVEGLSGPGSVNLAPADFRATWDASGRSRVIQLFIPHTFLLRVITEDWQGEPRQVEIVPQFLVRDPVVEGVVTRLAREAQSGSPSGQLYAESASEFLAHHIIHAYSSLSPRSSRAHGGLAGYRLKVVLDYIHESLAQPISLRALAELARVSTRHFDCCARAAAQ